MYADDKWDWNTRIQNLMTNISEWGWDYRTGVDKLSLLCQVWYYSGKAIIDKTKMNKCPVFQYNFIYGYLKYIWFSCVIKCYSVFISV